MSVWTDGRANRTIIFDQVKCKYVRVTATMIFEQVYIIHYNCNWPRFTVELLWLAILDTDITTTFQSNPLNILCIC